MFVCICAHLYTYVYVYKLDKISHTLKFNTDENVAIK